MCHFATPGVYIHTYFNLPFILPKLVQRIQRDVSGFLDLLCHHSEGKFARQLMLFLRTYGVILTTLLNCVASFEEVRALSTLFLCEWSTLRESGLNFHNY